MEQIENVSILSCKWCGVLLFYTFIGSSITIFTIPSPLAAKWKPSDMRILHRHQETLSGNKCNIVAYPTSNQPSCYVLSIYGRVETAVFWYCFSVLQCIYIHNKQQPELIKHLIFLVTQRCYIYTNCPCLFRM